MGSRDSQRAISGKAITKVHASQLPERTTQRRAHEA